MNSYPGPCQTLPWASEGAGLRTPWISRFEKRFFVGRLLYSR
jgi:hypothetical protein